MSIKDLIDMAAEVRRRLEEKEKRAKLLPTKEKKARKPRAEKKPRE